MGLTLKKDQCKLLSEYNLMFTDYNITMNDNKLEIKDYKYGALKGIYLYEYIKSFNSFEDIDIIMQQESLLSSESFY